MLVKHEGEVVVDGQRPGTMLCWFINVTSIALWSGLGRRPVPRSDVVCAGLLKRADRL